MKPKLPGELVWTVRGLLAAACAYVAVAVAAVVLVSPRVPFADAWRHYARLLDTPFPSSVLAADNGHPEIFANLVRYASLHWLAGDERLQIAAGLVLALATWGMMLRIVLRANDLPALTRAMAALALTLGVFWLGNARALLHDNESLHVYSVLLCVVGAIALVVDRNGRSFASRSRVAMASGLCFVAAFNFGSGIAGFAALFVLLFVQRGAMRDYLVVAAGLVLALLCYRGLAGGAFAAWSFRPWEQAGVALRWLAAPLIFLFWPLVDPAAAAALPHPFDGVGAIARAWTAVCGDVHRSVVPQELAGAALIFMIVIATLRRRRADDAGNPIANLGLALAWFGVGVAGMVGLTRTSYFAENPLQLYAPRYLSWSTLAWAGLLTVFLAKPIRRQLQLVVIVAIGVLALAAEGGMLVIMQHERDTANADAVSAVVGIWPDGRSPGENTRDDVSAGAAALRRAGTGPFAWPEAAMLGQALPVGAYRLDAAKLEAEPAELAAQPLSFRLQVEIVEGRCGRERLLVASEGRVVGLLIRDDGNQWHGAAIGAQPDALDVFEVPCARDQAL
ncbi:MAG: hypothetical protein ABIQ70_07515 [Dokdonella sp.]